MRGLMNFENYLENRAGWYCINTISNVSFFKVGYLGLVYLGFNLIYYGSDNAGYLIKDLQFGEYNTYTKFISYLKRFAHEL